MFTHNLNSTIFTIGPLDIKWYGLVYVIGFLLVWYVLNKKRNEFQIKKDDVETFIVQIILGTIIGGRLVHIIFWDIFYYIKNPLKIIALWDGGMAIHGALIGVILATYFFTKKHKIKFLKLADTITLPTLIALGLGRIANFINGEIVGSQTNLPWCVIFKNHNGCRHPVQLYGAAGRFLLLAYLAIINNTKKLKEGFIFWNFIFWMGLGRFIIDFIREDSRILGLSTGQYFSAIMFIIAGYVLWKYYRK